MGLGVDSGFGGDWVCVLNTGLLCDFNLFWRMALDVGWGCWFSN